MAANVFKMGPGTLTLGPAGSTELDISCQVTNAVLTPDPNTEDSVTVLCGDVIPGATTYEWKLTGTVLTDYTAGGIGQYSFDNRNKVVAFTYTPNTAAVASFAGELTMHPLAYGGDSGQNQTSDFEWPLVGEPVPTWPTPVGLDATYPATFTTPSTATYPTRKDTATADTAPEPATVGTKRATKSD